LVKQNSYFFQRRYFPARNINKNDDRLTFAELRAFGPSDVLDPDLVGGAHINLDLIASFGGNAQFPSLSSNFLLDWDLTDSQPETGEETLGGKPKISFTNNTLNLGEFLGDFLAPIVDDIQKVLGPIEPVIDFLIAPIPIISDLAGPVTVLDVIGLFTSPQAAEGVETFLEVLAQVIDF